MAEPRKEEEKTKRRKLGFVWWFVVSADLAPSLLQEAKPDRRQRQATIRHDKKVRKILHSGAHREMGLNIQKVFSFEILSFCFVARCV